jgi:gliding motility-associated-like protein
MEQKMLRSIEIEIFDRWGNMVFRSNDLGFRWDGSVAGQPLPEGTYVFHLKGMARDGQPVERSGSLTLLR